MAIAELAMQLQGSAENTLKNKNTFLLKNKKN